MLLQDKVVIVTGIGPGMGAKMARDAAAAGARVVMMSRSDFIMKDVVTEIEAAGGTVTAALGDVAKPEDCERVAKTAIDTYGTIDGLINSAYYHPPMVPLLDNDADDLRQAFDVIVGGALNMVRAVRPTMQAKGKGAVVNIGTMADRKPMAGEGGYVLAKGALAALTRQLALELGPEGIRVNMTVMGWLGGPATDMFFEWRAMSTGKTKEDAVAEATARIALGRIPPDDECGRAALMLLSDYAVQISGAMLDVNGGEYMPA
ncbi:SDR family oxidoreductase [Zavarzinia compransoris]|uniref:SDR family oxidoreductase n=1 Tax=Zavarzinia marina TaxID=2911065 RepID=UPI001F38B01C|nr:SDR family oxidoreductase [Zavarzinia marina]MCF4165255.1 SDR family oxidoreductase [Zavarzinia marina]